MPLRAGPVGKGYQSNQAWKMGGDTGLSDCESRTLVLHRWRVARVSKTFYATEAPSSALLREYRINPLNDRETR